MIKPYESLVENHIDLFGFASVDAGCQIKGADEN